MTGRKRTCLSLLGIAATVGGLYWGFPASTPAVASVPRVAISAPVSPMTQQQKALHLLNRFAFGPRPGDVEHVTQMGLNRWFQTQLYPESINDSVAEQRLSELKSLHMEPIQLMAAFPTAGQLKKLEAKGIEIPDTERMGNPRDILVELGDQKVVLATESQCQLQEVMVDFWENHFNINWVKGLDRYLLTDYDENVIRPHTLGKFKDLLEAVAHSPAMLVYLDNYVSTKNPDPNAPPPPNGRKVTGLNENYGRELMELHTLGVDGGYTQQDVIEVARCLTGWGIARPKNGDYTQPIEFAFHPRVHDEGQKVVLGNVIAAGGGENDGEEVLDILAHSPSTAHFLAKKLCIRFVADNPPESLVQRVAATYMQTDGDIRAMLTTIYKSPEFWSPEAYRAKIKTPFELVTSAMRAVNGHLMDGKPLGTELAKMGEGLYLCEPPTGYKDVADAWVSSGALLQRLNFSLALAEGRLPGVMVDLTPVLAPLRAADPQGEGNPQAVDTLATTLLHSDVSTSTRNSLEQAMTDHKLDYTELVGLILGSPEFQRR